MLNSPDNIRCRIARSSAPITIPHHAKKHMYERMGRYVRRSGNDLEGTASRAMLYGHADGLHNYWRDVNGQHIVMIVRASDFNYVTRLSPEGKDAPALLTVLPHACKERLCSADLTWRC